MAPYLPTSLPPLRTLAPRSATPWPRIPQPEIRKASRADIPAGWGEGENILGVGGGGGGVCQRHCPERGCLVQESLGRNKLQRSCFLWTLVFPGILVGAGEVKGWPEMLVSLPEDSELQAVWPQVALPGLGGWVPSSGCQGKEPELPSSKG